MYLPLRIAIRIAILVAAAVATPLAGIGAADAHELYTDIPDDTVVVMLSNQQTYNGGLSTSDAISVCNTDSESHGSGLLFDVQPHRDWELTACYETVHACTRDIPHEDGYLVAQRAGITLYTDDSGTRRFHCWTFPKEFRTSAWWSEPPAPPAAPAQESDPTWLVTDLNTGARRLSSTIDITRWIGLVGCSSACAAKVYANPVRVSGSWFVESSSAEETVTQALTYPDWDGEYQTSWLQPTSSGKYLFVNLQRTWQSVGERVLAPEYCRRAGVCTTSSSIRFVAPDGHLCTAALEVPTPPVGQPRHSADPVAGLPVTFDADKFAPGNISGPLTYRWRFDQGGERGLTAPVSGHSVSFTWSQAGTYAVELTASDAVGHQAVTTMQVHVEQQP